MKNQIPPGKSGSVLLLLAVFVLSGCASSPKIRSIYDDTADFGAYTTFNFMENAGPRRGDYESMFTRLMVAAITTEMENRGYTKSDNPDLLVNFNATFQDKTKVSTSPAGPTMGGYYGYRRGAYGAWGGYGYATETHVSQYTQGTFNIDIVDAKRMQLVWEAVSVSKVSEKDRDNLEERIKTGVPRGFAQYPFVAGNPAPITTK